MARTRILATRDRPTRTGRVFDETIIYLDELASTILPSYSGNNGKVLGLTAGELDWVTAGGGISDGDKGDITVSSSGSVWTIDNSVVSNVKMANMSADTIKGRANGAGAGAPQDLTATQVRTIINVASGAGISQLASTISDFGTAALAAAPAETTTTIGALINGATEKTTPADADFFGLMDSAAANILKKLSWANIKAGIQALTDTLYVAKNSAVTGATKTKITYDAKGLITAGDNATQDDIGDGTTYKQYSATDKTKLAGIAAGATANSTDAFLRDRANHTGSQLASTISDFGTAALAAAPAETTTTMGALINGATSKVTPVAADMFLLMDSAAGNVGKKISYANLAAAIGSAGVSDGDKGDITVTDTGATWTIDPAVVTNAKMANMAADTIKGRANGAGGGDPQDLTATQVRTIINVASGAGISQLASTISNFGTAALAAAPAETTTTIGTLINGATGKTTPVDADLLPLVDSAASNVLKNLTIANFKTWLNGLYQSLLVSGTNIKTINGSSVLGSGNLVVSGDPYTAKLIQASNVATGANVTPVNLTGMSFAYAAGGVYRIDIYGTVQAAAATTGHGFGVNCTSAPVLVSLSGGTILANTGTGTCWSAIANNAIVGVTSGLPSANTNVMSLGGGILVMNASTGGTCQFIFRSETTAVTTCMANTVIMITRVN